MNNFIFQALTQKLPQRILSKLGFDKKILRKQSTKFSVVNELILSKFEATLLGALIGDCVGKRYEGIWGPNLNEMLDELRLIKEKFDDHETDSDLEIFEHLNIKAYSDDTALTRELCESLVNNQDLDLNDLAFRFQQVYFKDPDRGYSSAAIYLFKKLSTFVPSNDMNKKCMLPAMELFNGEGSYGSGGGMRCSPIALFTFTKSLDDMKIICELSTRLTHTHIWAIIGSLQQCFAIRLALLNNKSQYSFDFDNYFNEIINFVNDLEANYELLDIKKQENLENYSKSIQENIQLYLEQKILYKKMNKNNKSINYNKQAINQNLNLNSNSSKNLTYSNLLRILNKLIIKCRKGERINLQRLYKHVTNCGLSAIESIPMGLFAFMIACDPKCSNEVNYKLNSKDAFKEFHPIERVIFYAISFGGETQKIASMAGAIAGAFFSRKDLPKYLVEMCESSQDVQVYAQKLFDLTFPNEKKSENEAENI